MMYRNCRDCKHLKECYPEGDYIEAQLDGNIKRDLCVNNDKVDWEQAGMES